MKPTRLVLLASGIAFCLIANSASAQYVWIDEKGVKQFSDMPPPASVPANRILKQPGATSTKAASTDNGNDPAASPEATPKGPPTTAERNAEFKKRRAEQAEKDKKAAEQAQRDAENAANCERARAYQYSLQSGERILQTDKNGERSYLSDEERQVEADKAQRYLANCK
jgi:hypothetical protein